MNGRELRGGQAGAGRGELAFFSAIPRAQFSRSSFFLRSIDSSRTLSTFLRGSLGGARSLFHPSGNRWLASSSLFIRPLGSNWPDRVSARGNSLITFKLACPATPVGGPPLSSALPPPHNRIQRALVKRDGEYGASESNVNGRVYRFRRARSNRGFLRDPPANLSVKPARPSPLRLRATLAFCSTFPSEDRSTGTCRAFSAVLLFLPPSVLLIIIPPLRSAGRRRAASKCHSRI